MRIILIFCLLLAVQVNAQDKITINNVDELSLGYKNGRKAKVCNGNVSFSQGDVTLTCNQAYLYDDVNEVEAVGNVYITQPGTTITGGNLYYYGNTHEAILTNNVVLNDGESTLTTNSLHYNTTTKYGYYGNGATIVSKENTLTSQFGSYSGNTKMYGFRKNVKLVNPEYVMLSDTMQYHIPTSTAFFYGPTTITAENNVILCRYGWYNTETEQSLFTKGATILSSQNTITADSLLYDRKIAIGRAFGNIRMIDSLEKVIIFGERGIHYRNGSLTTIYGNPLAKKAMEDGDSMRLIADTFNYYSTDSIRDLSAYRNAKILTKDMVGVCDSMIYSVQDSIIKMFYKPVLWTDNDEISGEYIQIHLVDNSINQMDIFENAWIVQEEAVGHYNQIKGDTMYNYFVLNKLKEVLVFPNAESVYYAKESDTAYTGINVIACEQMRIKLDSQVVKKIVFYKQPKAHLYPVDKIPSNKKYLKGFEQKIDRKPSISVFMRRDRDLKAS